METMRIANAPCSWGVLEFGLEGKTAGYVQVLDELAETGYSGTDLGDWGFMPSDPAALADELLRRGLQLVGAFVPVALKEPAEHTAGIAAALKTARLLSEVAERGAGGRGDPARPGGPLAGSDRPFIVLADDNGRDPVRRLNAGRIAPGMGLSDAEWAIFAAGADAVAAAVYAETGLRTAFHHHCAGYIETPDEIARLMALTDPARLGLVFDTGHYAYGAGNCAAVPAGLARLAERIWCVHFKDCQPEIAARARSEQWDYFAAVRHGVFCELGRGCVDFPAVVAWLQERGYVGWGVVEQDVLPGMGSPKESARRNREYLRQIGT